jgi:hypothetical protein
VAALIDLLVKIQLLDERQHANVQSRAKSPMGGHIVQQVAEMGYATESSVARAISVELGLPRIDLAINPPEPAALQLLDARTCADRFVLPVALRENGELLWLAMADPTDQEVITTVSHKTNKRVRPAVAGPTEILRAVRQLYGGGAQPETAGSDQPATETSDAGAEEAFEVLNVADDIGARPGDPEDGSPLSRIARQLGVEVPPAAGSRSSPAAAKLAPEVQIATRGAPAIPPKSDPRARPTFDELLPSATAGPIARDDLTEEDLSTIDALRASMEKGALVLRALAELCMEKGIFTREEMRKRSGKPEP